MNAVNLSAVFSMASGDGAGLMVMKKAMDNFKQDGENLVQLLSSMPRNAQPNLGKNVDIKA